MSDLSIGDTLALTNMVRAQFGHEPLSELPNATYGDPAACLFYRALAPVGCTGVRGNDLSFSTERQARMVAEIFGTRSDGVRVIAPSTMRGVIGRFDGDVYSHYNANRSTATLGAPHYYDDEEEESEDEEYEEDEE